jgi:UDP-glucose 4-epimerase
MSTNINSSLSGKPVLITGGLGFIGSNLVGRLVEMGSEVSLVDFLDSKYGGNLFNISGINDRVRVVVTDIHEQALMSRLAME